LLPSHLPAGVVERLADIGFGVRERISNLAMFLVVAFALLALSVPYRTYFGVPYRLGPGEFAALMFVVGCGMGIGKASVFKYECHSSAIRVRNPFRAH